MPSSNFPKTYVIIPARLASTRLPNKMLLASTGKSLIEHTYENACRARRPQGVIVATDHDQIVQAVRRAGGKAVLTSEHCASGTDRVAEVAATLPDAEIVVNVQGDEPELDPAAIDRVVELLVDDPQAVMTTLATPIRSLPQLHNPACVKVVFDVAGRALYFSRSPIPFVRDEVELDFNTIPALHHQHLGIYAYRRDFLLRLAKEGPTSLELAEKLEQLRMLQLGFTIGVGIVDQPTAGIDTADDYASFVARQRSAA